MSLKDKIKSKSISKSYDCIFCNYKTNTKGNYKKHIESKKHKENVNEKELHLFSCEYCNYKTFIKCNYEKHQLTNKHIRNESNAQKEGIYKVCEICNKSYKSKNGYWKHKKKFHSEQIEDLFENENETANEMENTIKTNDELSLVPAKDQEYKDLIMQLIKDNNELKSTILDVCKNTSNTTIIQNNTTNNTTNNNTFNLNIFLNEKCKDAMSIEDFINSIKLQVEDVIHVGKAGYVNGITKIISTNLSKLDITKRPLHCSDIKREIMYIKDKDNWEKDNEQKERLRKVVQEISMVNSRAVYLYREKYPDCLKYNSKHGDEYDAVVIQSLGGINKNIEPNQNKIMRNIAKAVAIDKDEFRLLNNN